MKFWKFLVLTVAFLAAVTVVIDSYDDGSDAATGTDIRVWIETAGGEYKETSVSASSVEDVINSAAEQLDIKIVYSDLGTIASVDGKTAETPYTWVVHQWMPLGTHDWAEVGFDSLSDSKLISGTSYCLHLADYDLVEGKRVYTIPDFKPISDGYVFIRFVYNYDNPSSEVQSAFTVDMRKEGFWLKGTGSTLAEVLQSAMDDNGFELQLVTEVDSNGNDLQGWIVTMFGLETVNLGGSTDWAYWSQYVYLDNEWSYNSYTMGYYDPGVYKYLSCIYIQSYDSELDFGGKMPDPDEGFEVMQHYHTVTFKALDEVVGTAIVEYGHVLTADQIPSYVPPEGYALNGWGNISSVITEDTVFEAELSPISVSTVTYYWNGGSAAENVTEGSLAKEYTVIAVPDYTEAGKVFSFAGWTLDPSSASPVPYDFTVPPSGNVSLYAYYTSKAALCTVTVLGEGVSVMNGDMTIISGETVEFGTVLTVTIADKKGYSAKILVGSEELSGSTYTIEGDTAFVGSYTANKYAYSVCYVDGSGKVLLATYTGTADYGSVLTPETPAIKGYTVPSKASLTISDLESENTLTYVYTVNKYTITFDPAGGSAVDPITQDYGTAVTAPADPVRDGYVFAGWDGLPSTMPASDITVTAKWNDAASFTLTISYVGLPDPAASRVFSYPSGASYSVASPQYTGYTPDVETVSGTMPSEDVNVTVTYSPIKYPVTWKNYDGTVLATSNIPYGEVPDYSGPVPVKTATAQYTFVFASWSPAVTAVIGPTEYTATFSETLNSYTVTWMDYDGSVLTTDLFGFGSRPVYGGTEPVRAATDDYDFRFSGWAYAPGSAVLDMSEVTVAGDTAFYAVYTQTAKRTVTFVLDGETVQSLKVSDGTQLTASQIPTKEGYTIEWDGNVYAKIVSDTVFSGTSEQILFTLRYYSENGTLLKTEKVPYKGAAEYSGTPDKSGTLQNSYSFAGWTEDPSATVIEDLSQAVFSDLSEVLENKDLYPVFLRVPNILTVSFYDYDRSPIATAEVEYGKAVPNIPVEPSREMSVDKIYTFKGWSLSPVGWNEADLGCVEQTLYVYAYYSYVLREYQVQIYCDSEPVASYMIGYGMALGDNVFMNSCDGYLSMIYTDSGLTHRADTTYTVLGDTVLYAKKLPGTYSYYSTSTKIDTGRMTVSFTPGQAQELRSLGVPAVADISMFPGGRTLIIDEASLDALYGAFGAADVSIRLGRGTVSVNLGGLHASVDGYAEFLIDKGPVTGKLSNTLKKVNYDILYSIVLTVGLSNYAEPYSVSVPFVPDTNGLNGPMVWSADYGTGILTEIGCSYSEGYLTFTVSDSTLYAVGTKYARSDESDESDPCPYGQVEYVCEGTDKDSYASTLTRMDLDNGGGILFVPSSLGGYPLKHISGTAFLGIKDVSALVVPATVETFDWSSFDYISVGMVCFVGDAPVFTGAPPSSLAVYHLNTADGWEGYDYGLMALQTCTLSNGASFTYYLLEGEIIVHRYVSGTEFKIPDEISVGGNNYPVTVIGPNAFQGSRVSEVKLPSTIREIQTAAFSGSSLRNITWSNGMKLESICDEAFKGCSSLRTSEIPDGVRFIGYEAYQDCSYLVTVTIPDSVKVLGGGAYYNCIRMENLTIGSGITALPERVFAYCNVLDNVYLPENVTSMGENAFYKCYMLTSIDTNNVASIGENAFALCSALRSVTFGKALQYLGAGVFAQDPLLTDVLAYCGQPDGLESAWGGNEIPDSVVFTVNYDVADGWTVAHEVQEKPDDLSESFESRTLPYVIAGLVVFFTVLIAYCYTTKGKRNAPMSE